jgi:outer membrane protein assembly factor BamB
MKSCCLFGRLWFASILFVSLLKLCAQQPGDKLWERGLGVTDGSVAIDADGTMYVSTGAFGGSGGSKIFALTPDATLRWEASPGSNLGTSVALGADGSLYVASQAPNPALYAMARDGSTKWSFTAQDNITTTPAVGPDGTIYFGTWNTKTFFAVNPDGTKKWQTTFAGDIAQSTPVIGLDGSIFIGSFQKKLHAFAPDGTVKWEFPVEAAIRSTPAVDRNGAVYVACDDDKVYCVNPDGTQKWVTAAGRTSPVITENGTVLVGALTGFLSALRGGSPPADSPWPMIGSL